MSILVQDSPGTYDFVGNGLGFKCKSNLHAETKGQIAIAEFTRIGMLTAGSVIQIYNPDSGQSVQVYVRDPAIDPLKAEVNSDHAQVSDQVNTGRLKLDLEKLPFFLKHYSIVQDGIKLIISTRKPFYFYWSDFFSLTASYSRTTIQYGIDAEYRANFKINVRLLLSRPTETFIIDFSLTPDRDSIFEFEIGKLLKPYIKTYFPALPGYRTTKFDCPYYLLLMNESYLDNGSQIESLYTYETGRVFKGKLDYQNYPGYSFYEDARDNKVWLNSNNLCDYWDGQEQFLYFFNAQVKSYMKVKAKAYFTDLSEWLMTFDYIDNRSETGVIHCIPVRGVYNDLVQNQREIYKFEIWIEHEIYGTGTYTVNKVFNVIDKPMHVRQFAFLNGKYGFLETFSAVSVSDIKLKTTKTIASHHLKTGYAVSDIEYSQKLLDAYNEIEVSTGSMGQVQALEFQQVLMSEEFYEIENNQYLPCIIDDGTFEIIPQSEDIVSVKFSYRRAYRK